MRSDWRELPFEEAIDFQEGPGILAKDFRPSGVPLVRLAGLGAGASVLDGCDFLDPAVVERRWSHFRLKKGDILLSTSASLGRIAIADDSAEGAIPYTGIIRMRPRAKGLDAPFIKYLLESPHFQRQVEAAGVGSVIRHFGPMHLRQMTVLLPPLADQRAIAGVLGSLDDKIDLNRRMNATLEATARAIFKAWFVDFEALPAEAARRKPVAMVAEKAAPYGDLQGWRAGEIGDIADVVDCLHSKKPERQTTGRPLLQLSNIVHSGLMDNSDSYWITETDYRAWSAKFEARGGDCVITNVGRVGAVAQVPEGYHAALGRNMTGLRCRADFPFPTFLIECLRSDAMREEIERRTDTGTILNALNVRSIPRLALRIPPTRVAELFEREVRPVRRRMELNMEESRTLAALRDALLPKLLSGEVRVKSLGERAHA